MSLLVVLVTGCVQSQFNLATRHTDYTITSTEDEVEAGNKLAKQVIRKFPLLDDEPVQTRVRTLGERIAAVCDRKELLYHFAVVKDDTVNAFSLPGGYVFIHEGLIKKTSGDDELAGVIAHEVAHIAARHAVKHYEAHLGIQLAQLASLLTRQGAAAQGVGLGAETAMLAYSRQDELEADQLAVKYLKAAGLEPYGILKFLEKLRTIEAEELHYLPSGVVRPSYASTHPFVPERIRAVKEALFGVADYLDYLNTPQ